VERFGRSAAASAIRIAAVAALVGLLGVASLARAQDASPFLNLDAGACDKLDDKNLQVGPPDADIVAACAALRRGAVLGQRFSGGPGGIALLFAGLALTYFVLGVPLRSVAGLLGRASGRSTTMLALEAGLALVLRAGVGLMVLALLSVPYAIAAGCVVMLIAAILSLRQAPAAPSKSDTAPAASRPSVVLADAINDAYASAAGILAMALLGAATRGGSQSASRSRLSPRFPRSSRRAAGSGASPPLESRRRRSWARSSARPRSPTPTSWRVSETRPRLPWRARPFSRSRCWGRAGGCGRASVRRCQRADWDDISPNSGRLRTPPGRRRRR
jgi:hypothetical protein